MTIREMQIQEFIDCACGHSRSVPGESRPTIDECIDWAYDMGQGHMDTYALRDAEKEAREVLAGMGCPPGASASKE